MTTVDLSWKLRAQKAEHAFKQLEAVALEVIEWERSYRTINHLGCEQPQPFRRLAAVIEGHTGGSK